MARSCRASHFFGVVFFVLVIGIILYGLYVGAYIRRYYYDAYSKIQDVYVDQDILDRMMGLYDVHIASATAASSIEAHIDGVDKEASDGLKNFLLQKLQTGGSGMSQSQNFVSDVPSAQSGSVTFASGISNRTYPIVRMWFVQQIIVGVFAMIIFFPALDFFVQLPEGNGGPSLTTSLGLDSGTLGIIFVALFVILLAYSLVYLALWRSNYSFSFLPDYIVTKQGIIAKKERHLPYRAVQDVAVSQGIVERILGIATVRIENAEAAQVVGRGVTISSAISIPGQSLMKANETSDAIKRIALTKNSSQTGL